MHAESESLSGSRVCAGILFPAAPDGDEPREGAVRNAGQDVSRHVQRSQPLVVCRGHKVGRPLGSAGISAGRVAPFVALLGRADFRASPVAVLQLTGGGDRVDKLYSVGTNVGPRLRQTPPKVVGSLGRNLGLAGMVVGPVAVVVVTRVVSAVLVVVVIVQNGGAVGGRLKVEQQICSLSLVPAKGLLARTRVHGRAGSGQLEIGVFARAVADVVSVAAQDEVLNGSALLSVGDVLESALGNQPLVVVVVVVVVGGVFARNFLRSDRLGRADGGSHGGIVDAARCGVYKIVVVVVVVVRPSSL